MHPMKRSTKEGNKREGVIGHNAKLRKLTTHYGAANPKMNKYAPVDEEDQNGPMAAVGFGVEGDGARPRSDRAKRGKAAPTTQVATYARGGRTKGKTAININVMPSGGMNSMQHPGMMGGDMPMPMHPGMAGAMPPPAIPPTGAPGVPPGSARPPMPLMNPAMMAAMGGGAPGMMPGGMPMRKRGGALQSEKDHPDVREDEALVRKMVKKAALKPHKRARGGKMPHMPHLEGGVASGPGREDNNKSWAKYGNKSKQKV